MSLSSLLKLLEEYEKNSPEYEKEFVEEFLQAFVKRRILPHLLGINREKPQAWYAAVGIHTFPNGKGDVAIRLDLPYFYPGGEGYTKGGKSNIVVNRRSKGLKVKSQKEFDLENVFEAFEYFDILVMKG